MVFRKTFFTDDVHFLSSRYFLKRMPGLAAKAYFLEINIKGKTSLVQTGSVRKVMAR
jgi:hypothetical protein